MKIVSGSNIVTPILLEGESIIKLYFFKFFTRVLESVILVSESLILFFSNFAFFAKIFFSNFAFLSKTKIFTSVKVFKSSFTPKALIIIEFPFVVCFIQKPLVSNEKLLIFLCSKKIDCKFSNFLFRSVAKGLRTVIEKTPMIKKHNKLGVIIFHKDKPELLVIM